MTAPARPPSQRAALAVAFGVIVLWASAFTIQKQVYDALTAEGFLLARYLLMPLLAAALLCRRYGRRWPRLSASDWRQMLLAAVLGQVLHVGLVTHGIDRSTAFSSALILACGPVFTLLVLRFSGVEHLRRGQIAGVLLACGGVLIFLSDKVLRADWKASLGDLMLLGSALLFALYTVQAKALFERHGGLVVMCYATLLGAPMMVLVSAGAAFSVDWRHVTPAVWGGFVWSVVFVAFFGWMLWGWVGTVRGVGRTAPLMYLMPPIAGLIAWSAGGEVFGPAKLVGAAVALGGVALAQWPGPRTTVA